MRKIVILPFLWILLLSACQRQVEPKSRNSLKIYVEDPALYYSLALYQREMDARPLSIHLRKGLDMFLQLSGTERSIDIEKSISQVRKGQSGERESSSNDGRVLRLALGGGLFLSSELPQLLQLDKVLDELPEDVQAPAFAANLDTSSGLTSENSAYLAPILLYPSLLEVSIFERTRGNTLLLDSVAESGLYRLISPDWLRVQLVDAPKAYSGKTAEAGEAFASLQTPQQILQEYLKLMKLQVRFTLNGIEGPKSLDPGLQQFLASYRQLLAGAESPDESLGNDGVRQSAGLRFVRWQQEFYQLVPKDYGLRYQGSAAKIAASSYPYLHFLGRLDTEKPQLNLHLEKVLWAGISKDLSQEQYQEALQLLTWLQSRKGQRTLQYELPKLDRDTTLGLYRGLSLYPEVNAEFWQKLQLDWPRRFLLRWILSKPTIQWDLRLFHDLDPERERLYRQQSAKHISTSFLLPYLFLPENSGGLQSQSVDWVSWLPPVQK